MKWVPRNKSAWTQQGLFWNQRIQVNELGRSSSQTKNTVHITEVERIQVWGIHIRPQSYGIHHLDPAIKWQPREGKPITKRWQKLLQLSNSTPGVLYCSTSWCKYKFTSNLLHIRLLNRVCQGSYWQIPIHLLPLCHTKLHVSFKMAHIPLHTSWCLNLTSTSSGF